MRKLFRFLVIVFLFILILILGINFYVKDSTKKFIVDDISSLEYIDCILVLGAGVVDDRPKPMLEDRLSVAILLYEQGVSSKMVMSGDHGQIQYDEVNVMKNYAIEAGVPSSDIFMDHAGFSTYESIYRVKEIFGARKIVIVTQEYHLYRALYIARELGIEAYGVGADPRQYANQFYRELREILARNKDFVNGIMKPLPTYLGEEISLKQSGDVTNDK